MRDKLLSEILMILITAGYDTEEVRSKLILVMDKYEVEPRTTELVITDKDDTEKYIKLFLIGKRVAGRTPRTIEMYAQTLKRFFRDVPKPATELTADDIKFYLAMKEVRDGVSKTYQKDILRVLSSFYQWMRKEEYMIKIPTDKVEDIKLPKVKKKAFTENEIELLRMEADGNIRMQCILEILLSTWCRISELVNMKISDITKDGEAVLVHGKGQKDRMCYLNAKAQIMIQKYLSKKTDDNPYLFAKCTLEPGREDACGYHISRICKEHKVKPRDWWQITEIISETEHADKSSIGGQLRKLGNRAGVKNTHPHRFRRTGATFALRRGMPIEQVSKLLGHESIETTQIYLDISEMETAQAHRKYV